MKFCQNCGEQLHETQDVCLKCGASVTKKTSSNDTGSFGWGLLGFCIPIVGLILYLVWKDDQPMNAKIAGKGAIIGFVINMIAVIIQVAIIISQI